MRDELFDELLQSVREAGKIRRGEQKASRSFTFEEPNVAAIRERLALSQEKFATMMGISVGTLRNWEQGRRKPEGPARALLRVAALHPEAVLESVAQVEAVPKGRTRVKRGATPVQAKGGRAQSRERKG